MNKLKFKYKKNKKKCKLASDLESLHVNDVQCILSGFYSSFIHSMYSA